MAKILFYTFLEFLEVCKNFNFTGVKDYKARFRQDSKLPSWPNQTYGEAFIKAGGWKCVATGKYYSFSEFLEVCKGVKFINKNDYISRYKQDPKLPSKPEKVYDDVFAKAGGWESFIVGKFYSFLEFLEVCKEMKFVSQKDYQTRYKQDERLPSCPDKVYKEDLDKIGGWESLTFSKFYSFPEFLEACKLLKFTSQKDYNSRYKQDPQLHSAPCDFYKEDWVKAGGWSCVTGKK